MLVQNIPLLKGQQLCPFLRTMDQQEQAALKAEKLSFNDRMAPFSERNRLLTRAVAGLGSFSICRWYLSERKEILSLPGKIPQWRFSFLNSNAIILTATLTMVVFSVYIMTDTPKFIFERGNTNARRDLRLQDKIRVIGERLLVTDLEPGEKEQLYRAKDFFVQKHEILSGRTSY